MMFINAKKKGGGCNPAPTSSRPECVVPGENPRKTKSAADEKVRSLHEAIRSLTDDEREALGDLCVNGYGPRTPPEVRSMVIPLRDKGLLPIVGEVKPSDIMKILWVRSCLQEDCA